MLDDAKKVARDKANHCSFNRTFVNFLVMFLVNNSLSGSWFLLALLLTIASIDVWLCVYVYMY